MAVEPIVDHRMRQSFRLLAVAGDDFPCAFNITGMNGYAPLIPFDPGADGVLIPLYSTKAPCAQIESPATIIAAALARPAPDRVRAAWTTKSP